MTESPARTLRCFIEDWARRLETESALGSAKMPGPFRSLAPPVLGPDVVMDDLWMLSNERFDILLSSQNRFLELICGEFLSVD